MNCWRNISSQLLSLWDSLSRYSKSRRIALWTWKTTSIGCPVSPVAEKLLYVSQTEWDGAIELRCKELIDLTLEKELRPGLLMFSPGHGIQQDPRELKALASWYAAQQMSLVDNAEAQVPDDWPNSSSRLPNLLTEQHPIALEQRLSLKGLLAQPQKSWTREISDAVAVSNKFVRKVFITINHYVCQQLAIKGQIQNLPAACFRQSS